PLDDLALQARQIAGGRHRAPKILEAFLRLLAPAAGESVGQHHRVDRARRRARNTLDRDSFVTQKMIEHAPRERTMRTAALQREIDAFDRYRTFLFGRTAGQ